MIEGICYFNDFMTIYDVENLIVKVVFKISYYYFRLCQGGLLISKCIHYHKKLLFR